MTFRKFKLMEKIFNNLYFLLRFDEKNEVGEREKRSGIVDKSHKYSFRSVKNENLF